MDMANQELNALDKAITIFTIGHSTHGLPEFMQLLQENNITCVVDVRTVPRSRHNPQFNKDTLPAELENAHIEYIHMRGLGGLRHTTAESPNTAWRNLSFRGYADYMLTDAFHESLNELIRLAMKKRAVLMCAEVLPWRCHRSLISDALLVRGIRVEHIMGAGQRKVHQMTPFARVDMGKIIYPSEEE